MNTFNSSYTASKAELEALYMDIRAERAWFGGGFTATFGDALCRSLCSSLGRALGCSLGRGFGC